MSKIVFFCIPAYGHTNPTIEVVRELVKQGNEVVYYSFKEFKDRIENAGAKCTLCDEYLPELKEKDEKKIGKDFSSLIGMVVDTTLSLEDKVLNELKEFKPDCIVSDSLSFWGKLFTNKLNIPYICSTTTFAMNDKTARLMKQDFYEILRMIFGMKKINKKIELLNARGYDVKSFLDIVKNDNDTETIVYTSKMFQPMSETFSERFAFVGPSISKEIYKREEEKKQVYISLGTVNNKNNDFYKNCIEAFKNENLNVVMSVGNNTDINALGEIPSNFKIENHVNQIKLLQSSDVFITHCGMNSVNEALYYEVPMVLFPQHSEQRMVANRASELGAGIELKKGNVKLIRELTLKVISDKSFKENTKKISESFKVSGGAIKAVDEIVQVIKDNQL